MLYKYENDVLEEYEVKINFELLKKVRLQIIENCSFIKQRTINSYSGWFIKDESIRNVELVKEVGRQEFNDGPDEIIYEYKYDQYYFPNIINVIDEVLKGNEKKISCLFETNDLNSNIDLYRDIDSLENVINLLNEYIINNDKMKLLQAKSELNSYEHLNIISPKRSIKDYYQELERCFVFNKKSTQSNEQIKTMKELYGENWKIILQQILNFENNVKDSIDNQYIKKMMK